MAPACKALRGLKIDLNQIKSKLNHADRVLGTTILRHPLLILYVIYLLSFAAFSLCFFQVVFRSSSVGTRHNG